MIGIDRSVGEADIQKLVRSKIDPEAVVLDWEDEGGYGTVLYKAPGNTVTPYIVHRWAFIDTARQPIDGGMLWSGHYERTLQAGIEEFIHLVR